ncbi:MAG TPA: hypothetical protein VFQ85_18165 [Mycobacteriales bacterium]|nr:hypothetical protein [Mycobacteriales bacterium]
MNEQPCPLLRELDAWFALALDVLAGDAAVRRDVLLLVGGAGTPAAVASVTSADCEPVDGHLFVYPPVWDGRSLPLTAGFVEVSGLGPGSWPAERTDPAADARAVESAVAAVDGALARITGVVREGGWQRLRLLRMHAWRHELGGHAGVLARCYGRELPELLDAAGDCPATRRDRDVADLVPAQRAARVVAVA